MFNPQTTVDILFLFVLVLEVEYESDFLFLKVILPRTPLYVDPELSLCNVIYKIDFWDSNYTNSIKPNISKVRHFFCNEFYKT